MTEDKPGEGDSPPRIEISGIFAGEASTTPDAITAGGLANERYAAQTRGLRQDIKERKKYARWIYWLLCAWLAALFGLLLLRGFLHIDLTDKVLVALITGTTANVLGIFAIVVAYLFPKIGARS